jgi:hypothetical protein
MSSISKPAKAGCRKASAPRLRANAVLAWKKADSHSEECAQLHDEVSDAIEAVPELGRLPRHASELAIGVVEDHCQDQNDPSDVGARASARIEERGSQTDDQAQCRHMVRMRSRGSEGPNQCLRNPAIPRFDHEQLLVPVHSTHFH